MEGAHLTLHFPKLPFRTFIACASVLEALLWSCLAFAALIRAASFSRSNAAPRATSYRACFSCSCSSAMELT